MLKTFLRWLLSAIGLLAEGKVVDNEQVEVKSPESDKIKEIVLEVLAAIKAATVGKPFIYAAVKMVEVAIELAHLAVVHKQQLVTHHRHHVAIVRDHHHRPLEGLHRDQQRMAQGEIKVLKSVPGDGTGYLIVDDLVDSGKTLELVRSLYPKAHFATVYAKPHGKPQVDTYVTEVSQDTWIFFPWDMALQYVQPFRGKD